MRWTVFSQASNPPELGWLILFFPNRCVLYLRNYSISPFKTDMDFSFNQYTWPFSYLVFQNGILKTVDFIVLCIVVFHRLKVQQRVDSLRLCNIVLLIHVPSVLGPPLCDNDGQSWWTDIRFFNGSDSWEKLRISEAPTDVTHWGRGSCTQRQWGQTTRWNWW